MTADHTHSCLFLTFEPGDAVYCQPSPVIPERMQVSCLQMWIYYEPTIGILQVILGTWQIMTKDEEP